MTIVELLRRRARSHPTRIAFASPPRATLTFAEWHERARCAAGDLACQIRRGERVALSFSLASWNEYAVAYMAVARAGGVCVPLAEGLSRSALDRVLGQVEARLLITAGAIDAGSTGARVRDIAAASAGRVRAPLVHDAPRAREPAEVLFTSGTTGPPAPVVATHANLARALGPWRAADRRGAAPGAIVHASAFASNAAQTLLLAPLRPGGRTVVSVPVLDAATLADVIERFGVDEISASPTTLLALADAREELDFSAIERINSVGAPVAPAALRRVAARFARARIANVYTSTEAWPARTTLHLGDGPDGSVGRPRGGSGVAVLDGDGRTLRAGEVGEVALTLPAGTPARTPLGAAPARGRTVKTGDLGFLDEAGYLHIVDRERDVINVGGAKVYSVQVEAALAQCGYVEQAAVVGVAHDTLGEYAVAAVTLRAGAERHWEAAATRTGEVELRRWLRDADSMGPRPAAVQEVVILPALPRNAAGKVDKRRLREILAERRPGKPAPRPSADGATGEDLLSRVLRAWRDALDLHDIGPDESFVALGGNSLLAMRILGELSTELAAELPARAYFDWTTPAELSGVLRELLAAEAVG